MSEGERPEDLCLSPKKRARTSREEDRQRPIPQIHVTECETPVAETSTPKEPVLLEYEEVCKDKIGSHNPICEQRERFHLLPKFYKTSTIAMDELRPMTFFQLKLNTISLGYYVVVRIFATVHECNGKHTIVEDAHGNICLLSLYNFPRSEELIVGEVLLIKEPYCLNTFVTSRGRNYHYIRVDSATDVVIITRDHELSYRGNQVDWKRSIGRAVSLYPELVKQKTMKSSQEWANYGHELLAQHKVAMGRFVFKNAQADSVVDSENWHFIERNLANLNHQMGCTEKALNSYRQKTSAYPQNILWLESFATFLHISRMFQECRRIVQRILVIEPNNSIAKQLQVELTTRASEQEHGLYNIDFNNWSIETYQKRILADYLGPVTYVGNSGNKGCCYLLNKDVEADTLLMAADALSFQRLTASKPMDYSLRMTTYLVLYLAEKIKMSPNLYGFDIYNLPNDVRPDRDIQLFCVPGLNTESICHIDVLKSICKINAIAVVGKENDDGPVKLVGCAIYPNISFINHSCIPNVYLKFYQEMAFVYSIKPMKEGEELLLAYLPTEMPSIQREEILEERDIKCTCRICVQGARPEPVAGEPVLHV